MVVALTENRIVSKYLVVKMGSWNTSVVDLFMLNESMAGRIAILFQLNIIVLVTSMAFVIRSMLYTLSLAGLSQINIFCILVGYVNNK
jgi:hypothetical protein